jgi:ABC-2 type transport system ATP-binding protein
MGAIIEVNQLTKRFNEITAVDHLSFTVRQGDVYGFLGQNGAGKSTTIRMLLGLIRPTSGNIAIFNRDISSFREAILRQTGAIIEKPDFYNYLSAFDNVSFLARISAKKISRKQVMLLLETVGLAQRSGSKVSTFSQGMKQRLGIAAALVHDPSLIILDEPTNGLDPQGIADTRELIKNLSYQHGKTVLISSHLLSEVELMANRILIIHQGRKIVEGAANELLDPSKTIVEIHTTNNNGATDLLQNSPWASYLRNPQHGHVIVQTDPTQVPFVVKHLVENNIGIISAEPRNSLEDYFLSVINPDTHVEPAAI